jgi:hypothetical protein
MATLCSLATVAELLRGRAVQRSSSLNQPRTHRHRQVVLKNHARDLDLFDRHQARHHSLVNFHSLRRAGLTNSLPAISADNFQQQKSRELKSVLTQRVRSARLACGLAERAPARQKENQCQEN